MSCIGGDDEMDAKHSTPIRAGGKRAKDFEISAPMWGMGAIIHVPENEYIHLNVLWDEDGYPMERFRKLEAEYESNRKAKNPNYRPSPRQRPIKESSDFHEYTDRPSRYR